MRQTLRKHGRDNRIFGSDPIPPSQWNYVGGGGTAEPPFENGWDNAGGGLQRLRFRITNEDQLEVEGVVTGGTAPVVTTLPDLDAHFRASVFWPGETAYAVGALGTADLAIWKLDVNGELSIAGTVASSSMGTADLDALGYIRYDFENVGDYLHILAEGTGATQAINIETDGATSSDGIRIYAAYDLAMFAAANEARLEGETAMVLAVNGSAGPAALTTNGGDITLDTGDSTVTIDGSSGEIRAQLKAGADFTLLDSASSPMLQMTEGSPDLHIPTGGSVIADL